MSHARPFAPTTLVALFAVAATFATSSPSAAQTNPPGLAPASPAPSAPLGTTGNPAANRGGIPGAVSPANPNAAARPQVPNISGSPVVKPGSGCGTGSASGRVGC